MKFVVVLVGAGAAAFLGALVCIVVSVYPPSPSPSPDPLSAAAAAADHPSSSSSRTGDNGTDSPVVAHAGPLGALQGGLNELGAGGGVVGVGGGGPAKQFSFNRLICTPVPLGDCNHNNHHHHHQQHQNHHQDQQDDDDDVFRQQPSPGDDPWAGDRDRTTADELRHTVVRQNDQILMDRRTIRELTGKLSECESGLEEEEEEEEEGVPARSSSSVVVVGGGGGGAWRSSNRRFMAGDDVSSAAAAAAAQLQTARAVEELERAIMDLKDRIEKLENKNKNKYTPPEYRPWTPETRTKQNQGQGAGRAWTVYKQYGGFSQLWKEYCNHNNHHHHHQQHQNHHQDQQDDDDDVFRQQPSPGDDPWAGDRDRTTADELRHTVVRQNDQILMDRRTIRELTGKLSECESGLEEEEEEEEEGVPARSSSSVVVVGGGGGGAWRSSNRRFMAGDDVSSAAAAAAAQLQTARAVEELERAIMDLKDRIEKLEAEIGPSALNLTDVSASTLGSGGGASNSGASNIGPASPGSKTPSPPRPASPGGPPGGRRPSAAPRPPPAQGGGGGRGGGKGTWKVGEVEGELERKIKLLEKERQTMRKENQGHRDNIDKGLDAADHRLAELEHRRTCRRCTPFTACLWLKAKEGGIGTPLLLLRGPAAPVPAAGRVAAPLRELDPARRRVEGLPGGKMKGRGEGLAAWHPIKPGGVLVLGQEQDTLGGRFDASQALVGELSQFNLWDRVLKPAEVAALADCSSAVLGSVAPWTTWTWTSTAGATKESLDPCHAAQRTNLKGPKHLCASLSLSLTLSLSLSLGPRYETSHATSAHLCDSTFLSSSIGHINPSKLAS
ncbi:hypothetical protein CRUP_031250 [Coryphaenoides rupestris]|nr:hypothetical protein CRUP_031250 [Coryphaenoides rupestris]